MGPPSGNTRTSAVHKAAEIDVESTVIVGKNW
jgi:hypothetical protein